jgi:uncharacterized membrane protein YfcA
MKEKTIVSTATLLASLLTYWYAKEANKDAVPYMMMGGFLGAIIGETIVENIKNKNKNNN